MQGIARGGGMYFPYDDLFKWQKYTMQLVSCAIIKFLLYSTDLQVLRTINPKSTECNSQSKAVLDYLT